VLESHQDGATIGFQLHVDGLRTLLILAHAELRKAKPSEWHTRLWSRTAGVHRPRGSRLRRCLWRGPSWRVRSAGTACIRSGPVPRPTTWCSTTAPCLPLSTVRSPPVSSGSLWPVRSVGAASSRRVSSIRCSTGGTSTAPAPCPIGQRCPPPPLPQRPRRGANP
jgi:hypothetical protein